MNIRKKIIVSNILMIIVPIVITVLVVSIFVRGAGSKYWDTMENVYEDSNGVYGAQSLIYTYKNNADAQSLVFELNKLGYHINIEKNHKVVFSNLEDKEKEGAQEVLRGTYEKDTNITVSGDDVAIIKQSYKQEGIPIKILAVYTKEGGRTTDAFYIKEYIFVYIATLICLIVIAIVFMNIILTSWIARSILGPLKKLSVGTSMVRKGNLDFKLEYNKNNEIGLVCQDFEAMRGHLKDAVEERLKYENFRKQLMRGISHDLRTPLTSIRGYTEGLRDGIATTEEKKAKYYRAMETSINQLENLMDRLTEFSGTKEDGGSYKLEKTNINVYYKKAIADCREKYFSSKVYINFYPCTKDVNTLIDPFEMDRINNNILENSLKYRENSKTNVSIRIETDGEYITMIFADDGPGVPEKDLENIFNSFYRGDYARTKPGEGSGIGLAVVKQIAEAHQGNVKAINDKGLTIIVKIPEYKEV